MDCNLINIAENAKARFPEIPFPHKKDEYWRFADLNAWNTDALFPHFSIGVPESNPTGKLLEAQEGIDAPNTVAIFDGQGVSANLSSGLSIMPITQAVEKYPNEVAKFYESAIGKFDTLVSTRATGGIVFVLDNDTSAKLNLKVISKLGLSVSSILFIIGNGAKLELMRTFATNAGSFSLTRMKFILAENATVELATFKYSDVNAHTYLRDDFDLANSATVRDGLAELGISPSRTERNFEVLGNDVNVDSRAFVKSSGSLTHDLRTSQMHRVGGSHSNLSVKSVVGDTARLAFMGVIRVEEDAQQTKAYQSCNSLSLSDSAKTQASPILEIMANDVECSHGCTVSKPDAEEVFYMNQRGLSEADALELIIEGFARTTFEHLPFVENI
ncbi:MAG: SufD family Fe-S cluster assembly protein [Opitutales bacterium]|nr:SufD family Fe-S cluster assembly protein [Opitutales bacterium]